MERLFGRPHGHEGIVSLTSDVDEGVPGEVLGHRARHEHRSRSAGAARVLPIWPVYVVVLAVV